MGDCCSTEAKDESLLDDAARVEPKEEVRETSETDPTTTEASQEYKNPIIPEPETQTQPPQTQDETIAPNDDEKATNDEATSKEEQPTIVNDTETDNDSETDADVDKIEESVEEINPKEILNEFVELLKNKDFQKAMNIIQTNSDMENDFFDYVFDNGDNLLLYSVKNCVDLKFAYFLLQSGVDVNGANSDTGETALQYAASVKNVGLITMLMKYEVDASIENKDGKTAADIAKETNDEDIIQLIDPDFKKMVDHASKDAETKENDDDGDINSKDDFMAKLKATAARKKSEAQLKAGNDDDNKTNNDENNIKKDENETKNDENNEKYEDSIEIKTDDEAMGDDDDKKEAKDKLGDIISLNAEPVKDSDAEKRKNAFKAKLRQPSKRALDTLTDLKKKETNLPELGEFLELKEKKYKKRFVFVKDGHLMWHDKKVALPKDKKLTRKQRSQYLGCVNLLVVNGIKEYKSKKKNTWKFEVTAPGRKGKNITYLFLCKDEPQRKKWVDGLNKHWDHQQNTTDNLGGL